MKKYIIPTINVASIENDVILAGSGGLNDGDSLGQHPVDGGNDNNFSRDRNIFDWSNEE